MSLVLPIPNSIGTVIGSIVTTAFKIGTVARDISNAPNHIQRLCAEAETCRGTVLSLKVLLLDNERNSSDKNAQDLIYVSNLLRVLSACEETLQLLEKEIEALMKENMMIGIDERARWIWREEEISKLLRCLESHKVTLNITLNVLNLHHTQEVKRQNARILNYIMDNEEPRPHAGELAAQKTQRFVHDRRYIGPGPQRKSGTLSVISEESEGSREIEIRTEESIMSDGIQTTPENELRGIAGQQPIQQRQLCGANLHIPLVSSPNLAPTYGDSSELSFEDILLVSRVYRNRRPSQKLQRVLSDLTWSDLRRSGASILNYRLRSPLSGPIALVTTKAPLAILTRDQKRLNDAFLDAVIRQDMKAMTILLEFGAEIEPQLDSTLYKKSDAVMLPLWQACSPSQCNPSVIKFLLDHGADADRKVCIGGKVIRTVLHMVVGRQTTEVLQILLAHGANIEQVDGCGQTPIFHAINGALYSDGIEASHVVKMLLQAGANVLRKSSPDSKTPLHRAAYYNNPYVVKLLLEHGAKVNALDHEHRSPLFNARFPKVAKILLESGADVNARDKFRQTPLMSACLDADSETVKLLLQHGADLGALDSYGETALFFAVGRSKYFKYFKIDRYEVVQSLLEAGADCSRKNSSGQIPLDVAKSSEFRNHKVEDLLKAAFATQRRRR